MNILDFLFCKRIALSILFCKGKTKENTPNRKKFQNPFLYQKNYILYCVILKHLRREFNE